MNSLRVIFAIAGSVLLEAVRRRDVYVIVLICGALVGVMFTVDFLQMGLLVKFYREIALRAMSLATAVAVILLAIRQLPREFEYKTIYPLLARPVSRPVFLLGKGVGVCAAALFCLILFSILYAIGMALSGGTFGAALFFQHLYLQVLQMMLVTSGCFLLSLLFNPDAALTLGFLLYFAADVISHVSLAFYQMTNRFGQWLLVLLTYALPQVSLFDLSEKTVHAEIWSPLPARVMLTLTLYALGYTALYGAWSHVLFRRRPL